MRIDDAIESTNPVLEPRHFRVYMVIQYNPHVDRPRGSRAASRAKQGCSIACNRWPATALSTAYWTLPPMRSVVGWI